MKYTSPLLFLILLFNPLLLPAQNIKVFYNNYQIDGSIKKDSSINSFLSIYRDSITKSMGTVIGFSVNGMSKHQPESGLGNFMADAIKEVGQNIFSMPIDAAFINYGGIRGYIPKGEVTIGTVYELMPFDNLLIIQKVRGDSLLTFLHHIAQSNGWPLSGITMGIKEKKAENVLINNKPIVADSLYTIANSDYIAKGGDKSNMLKCFPVIDKGYLVRDALIYYIKKWSDNGKSIDCLPEKRIVYVN